MLDILDPPVVGAAPVLHTISTEDVTAPNRRSYWMASAYRAVEGQPAPGVELWGRLGICGSVHSGQFVHCESSAVRTRMTPARLRAQLSDEHIAICSVGRGSFQVEDERGTQSQAHAGDLFMFDCGQAMRGQWTDSDAYYLRLPRRAVRQALGRDPADCSGVVSLLPARGLAPFLSAQLQTLGSHGVNLSVRELSTALQFSVAMALSLLTEYFGGARGGLASDSDRLRLAYHYMGAHAHRLDLTVNTLAQALHCSRAQLYRMFENEPLSVKATLRDIRLSRARDTLVQAGPRVNVGAVAYACGFSDASVFGKLFRQRFRMTPSEVARGQPANEFTSEPLA